MSMYPEDLSPHQLCHVDGGHDWDGGACSRCGERLRCGACQRFVSIDTLTDHIDNHCPVKWEEYEGEAA